jgi:hypothetical protein
VRHFEFELVEGLEGLEVETGLEGRHELEEPGGMVRCHILYGRNISGSVAFFGGETLSGWMRVEAGEPRRVHGGVKEGIPWGLMLDEGEIQLGCG